MKKIISLLTVIVLVAALATAAFAAEESALYIADVEAAAGEEVVVNIEIVNNPGLSLGEFVFNFDTTALEFVSATAVGGDGWAWLCMVNDQVDNAKFGSVVFSASDAELTGDAVLVTLTLKVKDDVKPGKYPVNAVVDFIGNDDVDFITATTYTGYVVIPCTDATHLWGEWVVTKEAACGVAGEETRTCSNCGATETREIAALEHNWVETERVEATGCTDGKVVYTCSNCGETKEEVLTAAGEHTWNEGEVTTEATCCTAGVKTFTCTVCGATKTEEIAATGEHKVAYVDNEDGKTHKIICENSGNTLTAEEAHEYGEEYEVAENPGWKYKDCTKCGYVHAEDHNVPPTGDNTMIAVALATLSMMSIALVVTKKEF